MVAIAAKVTITGEVSSVRKVKNPQDQKYCLDITTEGTGSEPKGLPMPLSMHDPVQGLKMNCWEWLSARRCSDSRKLKTMGDLGSCQSKQVHLM